MSDYGSVLAVDSNAREISDVLVRAGKTVEKCCLSAVLVAYESKGQHVVVRQGVLVFLIVVDTRLAEIRAGNFLLTPWMLISTGSPIGANFTMVISAPGMIPISRKCCRKAPSPPTFSTIQLCPALSSFKVIQRSNPALHLRVRPDIGPSHA